jgi:antibiotic biosynthesis monooxygenase (ABM) superfamily enzyme
MIRHVVLWRLKPGNSDIFGTIRTALEAQCGEIPGLMRVEVGRNFADSRRAVDMALICDFESREALAAYHRHPAHMRTRAVVDPLAEEHWIVDYEL